MDNIGRYIILAGIVLVMIGGIMVAVDKIPWLGRLPGDISIERDGYSLYFPVTTCLLVSVALTVLFYFIGKR